MTGQILSLEEQEAQIAASTLTGARRYKTYRLTDTEWMVWDHEQAREVADRDGNRRFSERDAHDLMMEHIG